MAIAIAVIALLFSGFVFYVSNARLNEQDDQIDSLRKDLRETKRGVQVNANLEFGKKK